MTSNCPGTRRVWPFAGRAAELDWIKQRLRGKDGRGVVIAGEPGLGKSRLLAEAVRAITATAAGTVAGAAGVRVMRVTGTEAGAAIPFGAFAHLLPADPIPREGMATLLRWAAAGLRPGDGGPMRPARGSEPVLVVDDAHLLDHASAALVHHLALRRAARLVVAVRAGAGAPDAVVALWKDDLLPRLELAPLPEPAVAAALTAALDGHVEALTVRRLHQVTTGNVLWLRELVTAGLATGALSRADGVWSWRGELPVAGRVRELIETAIGDIDDDEREALEYVAIGEPLDDDVLAGLARPAAIERAIERLETRRLVTGSRDGARLLLRPAHPLYGEVVRAGCGPLRTRRIKRRLADAIEAAAEGTVRRADALRVAVWRLDSGGAPDPAVLIEGSRLAWAAYDTALAVRLGRAALAAGGGAEAALALTAALSVAGQEGELAALLPGLSEQLTADRLRARCAITRAYGRMFAGEDPQPVLAAAAGTIAEPRWRQDVHGMAALLGLYSDGLYSDGLYSDGRFGDGQAAADRIARVRNLATPEPVTAARLAAAEATALAHAGRTERCLAVVAAALREAARWCAEDPTLLPALECARLLAGMFAGDLDGAWAAAATGERLIGGQSGWDIGFAGLCGHRAQLSRLYGRIGEALAWSRDGAGRLPAGPAGFAGICLGELAHAAALTGDAATARRALTAAESRTLPTFRTIDFAVELARPWVLAAGGDLTGAVRAAVAVADLAAGLGLRGHEMFALHDAVRLGAADLVADRLDRLADSMDGALAPVFARHAAAYVARDPAELDVVAKQLEQLGLALHAAEAHAHTADAYRRLGDPRRAQPAATRAWTLARDCRGAPGEKVCTPALADLAAPGLTARQREIAHLAASGLTNREIAERLTVSIRTVANHLCGVYERLGVNDRAGLGALLGTLD
jgi:DNA-binding NarL/FixJ family response regulator